MALHPFRMILGIFQGDEDPCGSLALCVCVGGAVWAELGSYSLKKSAKMGNLYTLDTLKNFGVPWWLSRLRTKQVLSLLWLGFSSWLGNFHMLLA